MKIEVDGRRNHALLDSALSLHEAGFCVLPVDPTTKAPTCGPGWDRFFTQRQTEADVRQLFSNDPVGIGAIQYPASPWVVVDIDGPHGWAAWRTTGLSLEGAGKVTTQSGGFHYYFRAPKDTTELNHIERKVRLVKADCDCKKDGRPKPCGVDLLVRGYAVCPPTRGYREDPDFPIENAIEIPQQIIAYRLNQKREESKGPKRTGNAEGRVDQGERRSTLVSLAGTMRARGMSIEAIRSALETDNETRFDPPVIPSEIENVIRSVEKWEQGTVAGDIHLTDLGNAQRLVRLYGNDLHYCSLLGWLCWDGRRWRIDDTAEIMRKAKDTVRAIYQEAADSKDKDRRDALAGWATRSESAARIEAIVRLAESEPGIVLTQDKLDSDPWLLNVANGTLDLRSGELTAHSPDNLITKLIDVEYHPDAKCPTWEKFLERVLDRDADLIRFIQKALGYSLTGSTREQVFFINYGTGQNGKTTLQDTVRELLGDYAKQTSTETILIKRFDGISNDVARLAGARFVCAVETESGRRLAESLVKAMTGGDTLSARFLYRETFQFKPTFKLWLAVNHKPRILGTDAAIWRRIHLNLFRVTISGDEIDLQLGEKLKAEHMGILAWCVRGCLDWQAEGLKAPTAVALATAEYRSDSDSLAEFIGECCKLGPEEEVSKSGLYERFSEWAKSSGEYEISKRELGLRLKERGFSDGRTKSGRFWDGIGLISIKTNDE